MLPPPHSAVPSSRAAAADPVLIAPCFNKFTPLERGPLRERIEALARRLRFPLAQLYVVDSSRRSAHRCASTVAAQHSVAADAATAAADAATATAVTAAAAQQRLFLWLLPQQAHRAVRHAAEAGLRHRGALPACQCLR